MLNLLNIFPSPLEKGILFRVFHVFSMLKLFNTELDSPIFKKSNNYIGALNTNFL